jgi:hypothetical protein
MTQTELIAAVRAHARKNYNSKGWDILVECWDDADIIDAFGNCISEQGAIRACAKTLGIMDSVRHDIQAEAF